MDKIISKEEIEYLVGLGEKSQEKYFKIINGKYYAIRNNELIPIEIIDAIKIVKPIPIKTQTLTSVIDYVIKNPDKINPDDLIINVKSPTNVKVISKKISETGDRNVYLESEYEPPEFRHGFFYNKETFLILLNTCFVETADLQLIFSKISKMATGSLKISEDDGISQKIQTKSGIDLFEESTLPRLVTLKQFRVFPDIDQAESYYLLRARKKDDEIELALFEADGGSWKNKSMQDIANFLGININTVENMNIPILS